MSMTELMTALDEQSQTIEDFKTKHLGKVDHLQRRLDEMQAAAQRPDLSSAAPDRGDVAPLQSWVDTKTLRPIDVLSHGRPLAKPAETRETPSIGRVLRGLVLGGKAHDHRALNEEIKALGIAVDPSGGYTVGGALSSVWIDRLRSAMVLSRAGAMTVPMETSELTIAKLTGDPTVSWHGENGTISDSEATFGAVTLRAKTCVCLVKLSLEVSQDSANIEEMLQRAIIGAMARSIDSAGLLGVTSNAGAAPASGAGVFGINGRNTVTSVGAPTSWDFLVDGMYELMVDDMPAESIGAMVAHPALWRKMRKLKTGLTNDNTPLTMPDEVANLPKLWTTAAPTDKAVIADWRDLLFGVRKDITVRVLQERFLADSLQIAVMAYARVDFAPARAASFCTMEGITT